MRYIKTFEEISIWRPGRYWKEITEEPRLSYL